MWKHRSKLECKESLKTAKQIKFVTLPPSESRSQFNTRSLVRSYLSIF